eukprot:CAMPEP_0198203778 /NCGR_PEP_ID=MMETSP1445-20131203/7104_1 /TAXON_ID=36898 /ORGANISM="Pyramimonas sp., Strain CCMP2087" /LENGTH=117 /DNA_ID=CAMNT_0043875309 /DNA_START=399 /DNA_END=752 /DNA_ORIENTATION=+
MAKRSYYHHHYLAAKHPRICELAVVFAVSAEDAHPTRDSNRCVPGSGVRHRGYDSNPKPRVGAEIEFVHVVEDMGILPPAHIPSKQQHSSIIPHERVIVSRTWDAALARCLTPFVAL